MPTLEASNIADLVTSTLRDLGRLRFTQIAQNLTNYEVMSRILKKDKVQFDDGYGIQKTLMVDYSSSARNVGMFETDDVNVEDFLQTIDIPWRHTTANWAYEVREVLMNRGASRIVDMIKTRRIATMIGLAERMEADFFAAPGGSTDKTNPFGLPYWVVKYASGSTTGGFYGGNHASYSSGPGGLNSNTYTNWRNYTCKYTNVAKSDLITKLRTAYRKIRFKSPVDIPDYRKGVGQQYRIYAPLDEIIEMETLAENQNENLGRDLAAMDGTITFRRNPIVWIETLDSDSDAPIYLLDWSKFYPVFLKGDYLRESPPKESPSQHNVYHCHLDLTWNILCTDRRAQACLSTGRTTNGSAALS